VHLFGGAITQSCPLARHADIHIQTILPNVNEFTNATVSPPPTTFHQMMSSSLSYAHYDLAADQQRLFADRNMLNIFVSYGEASRRRREHMSNVYPIQPPKVYSHSFVAGVSER